MRGSKIAKLPRNFFGGPAAWSEEESIKFTGSTIYYIVAIVDNIENYLIDIDTNRC
jgi:hypothetical protein